MKTRILTGLCALASAASLPAAVTITADVLVPNGSASGGNGAAAALNTNLSINVPGTITASTSSGAVTLPTTYTVSGVDLTSVGGTNNENFTFTMSYTSTTNGVTPGSVGFSGYGNVGAGGDFLVSGTETLTATIALTSSSFAGLSLTGFSHVRAGGFGAGETGTFTWSGGSHNIGPATGNTVATGISGSGATAATLTSGLNQAPLVPGSNSTLNFEGFGATFVAVPEPSLTLLGGLGALALMRRRRSA